MTSRADENAALARRYLADVVAGDDRRATRAFLAEDAQIHDLVFDGGRAGWPLADGDLEIDIRDVIATEDRVAIRGFVQGHSAGGGHYEVAAAWFCRIDGGRIAELWFLPDGLGLLHQTGKVPPTDRSNGVDSHQ